MHRIHQARLWLGLLHSINPIWRFMLCWVLGSLLLQLCLAHWAYYERGQLFIQPWRLWTGQWVHLGWMHYVLNMLALLCLPLVLVKCRVIDVLSLLLTIAPLLSLVLYVRHPELQYYAGLSGVLHGIYVALAVQHLNDRFERKIAVLLLLAILAKITYEQWHGDSQTAALIGFPVIIDAHLYGALLGAIMGGILLSHNLLKQRHTQPQL